MKSNKSLFFLLLLSSSFCFTCTVAELLGKDKKDFGHAARHAVVPRPLGHDKSSVGNVRAAAREVGLDVEDAEELPRGVVAHKALVRQEVASETIQRQLFVIWRKRRKKRLNEE